MAALALITASGLAGRLAGLDSIGVSAGGVTRLGWTSEAAATQAWFEDQAAEAGLRVEVDPAGNLWARPRDHQPPWWAVGSHLDSVRDGGRFDGPLGVACGFELAHASPVPLAVISFADEEGARWGTPTFGSKALVGRLEVAEVLARRDAEGVPLADAMRAAGLDPGLVGEATTALVKLAGFIEIHIDQSTEVAEAGRPCGIVKALAARRRLELTFRGQADHAGTTPREARHDALAAAARLIVTAEDRAASVPALTVTASRLIVDPNAPTTIASRVRLWIDARAPDEEPIEQWSAELGRAVDEVGARYRVAVEVTEASRSPAVRFSQRARAELRAAAERELGAGVPEVVCYAGHDAGILAERIPAAMLLVRNRQGISHAPEEAVELEDAAAAARVVARALDRLAGTSVP